MKVEKADQRRIRELEGLQKDVEKKKEFGGGPVNFKDCRPERSKKHFPLGAKEKAMKKGIENQSRQSNISVGSTMEHTTRSQQSTSSIQANTQTGGIVKTVLLPYDEIVNLKNELEYLKQYKIQ